MYKNPDDHRDTIVKQFTEDFVKKYDIGQKQHGGNLYEKNVQWMAKEEALDFVSYLYTLIDQLSVAIEMLGDISPTDEDWFERVTLVRNLLVFGNINGKVIKDIDAKD